MFFFQKQEDCLFKKQQITFAKLKGGQGLVEDKNSIWKDQTTKHEINIFKLMQTADLRQVFGPQKFPLLLWKEKSMTAWQQNVIRFDRRWKLVISRLVLISVQRYEQNKK